MPEDESVYKTILLGVRDYIEKNHFNGVVVGLSGGVDSALTLPLPSMQSAGNASKP